jgi:hypothetical protein
MNPPQNIFLALTAALGNAENRTRARIVPSTRTAVTAAEALVAFFAFGGTGWLCTLRMKEPWVFHGDGESLPDDFKSDPPLHGEAVKGSESLHLRQDGDMGWTLTTLREEALPQENAAAAVIEKRLLSRDPKLGTLIYRVGWELAPSAAVGGPQALRPSIARFAGFAND